MRILLALVLGLTLFGCDKGKKKEDAPAEDPLGMEVSIKPAVVEILSTGDENKFADVTESLKTAEILGFSHKIYEVNNKLSDIIELPGEFKVEQDSEDGEDNKPAGDDKPKDDDDYKSLPELKAAINEDNCYSKDASVGDDEDTEETGEESGHLKLLGSKCPIRTEHKIEYNEDPDNLEFSEFRKFKIRKSKHRKLNDVYEFESTQSARGNRTYDEAAEKKMGNYVVRDDIVLKTNKFSSKINVTRIMTQSWAKNNLDLVDNWNIKLQVLINYGKGELVAYGLANFSVVEGVPTLSYSINDKDHGEDAEDFTRIFGMNLNGFNVDKDDTTDGNKDDDDDGEDKIRKPQISMRCVLTLDRTNFRQPLCLNPNHESSVSRRVGNTGWMSEIITRASETRDRHYTMTIKLTKLSKASEKVEQSTEIKSTSIKPSGELKVDKQTFKFKCQKVSACK